MTSASWPIVDVDDVGFVDLDLGGDDGHVGEGHERRALGVLNAGDDHFALADGLVGDDAIEGSDGDGAIEEVLVDLEVSDLGLEMAAGGGGIGSGLGETGDGLGEGGDIEVVGGFFGVEVLLGHDLGLEEGLGAVIVELFLLEVGLGMIDVGLGGFLGGDIGIDVGAVGGDGGLLRGDIGFLLDVLDGGDDLALLNVVAFIHVEVGNAAHGVGADVDVSLGPDLAGGAHDGNQVLLSDSSDQDLGVAGLSTNDSEPYDRGENHDGSNNDKNLFQSSSSFAMGYAIPVVAVPPASPTTPSDVQRSSWRASPFSWNIRDGSRGSTPAGRGR